MVDAKDVKLYTGAVFYRDHLDDYLTRYIDFQKEPAPLIQFINEQSAGGGNDFPGWHWPPMAVMCF